MKNCTFDIFERVKSYCVKFAPIEQTCSVERYFSTGDAKSIIHSPINSRRCSLSHDTVAAGLSQTVKEESGVRQGNFLSALRHSGPRSATGTREITAPRPTRRRKERCTARSRTRGRSGGRTTDICHALSRSLPNATRYDKICKSSPHGYSSAFSRRARTAPHRARSHSCDHLPNTGRVYIARWVRGQGERRRWTECAGARRTYRYLPLRRLVGECETTSLRGSPRHGTATAAVGMERAVPRRFPPPPSTAPLSRYAAPCHPLVYLSRRRTVHLFPFRSSLSASPGAP